MDEECKRWNIIMKISYTLGFVIFACSIIFMIKYMFLFCYILLIISIAFLLIGENYQDKMWFKFRK